MPWQTWWLTEVQIDFGKAYSRAERSSAGRDRLLLIDDQVMAKTVELAGRDPGLTWGDEVEHFPGEFPGNAHALDLLRSLQMYRHAFSKKSAKDKTSTPWGKPQGAQPAFYVMTGDGVKLCLHRKTCIDFDPRATILSL